MGVGSLPAGSWTQGAKDDWVTLAMSPGKSVAAWSARSSNPAEPRTEESQSLWLGH